MDDIEPNYQKMQEELADQAAKTGQVPPAAPAPAPAPKPEKDAGK